VVPPEDEHDCGWRTYAEALTKAHEEKLAEVLSKLSQVSARLEEVEKSKRGHRSEKRKSPKMPPAVVEPATRESTRQTREERAALRDARVEVEVEKALVPPEQCSCPKCGNTRLREVGRGTPSTTFDYVPGYFRKRTLLRQTLSCRCGHIVTAPGPDRVGEKTRYGASFIAHLCVSKCSDSIPQYRLEKEYQRLGIPLSRSTMCSLFHRGAEELRPLYNAACALVPRSPDVHADETSIRQIGLGKKAFVWDFVTPELIVYVFAQTRSGDVPKKILGDSQGRLVVDQHTGYNAVTKPGQRVRAGCLAHARRKIFEQSEHPAAKEALDLIGEIYRIERDVKKAGLTGSEEHLELRKKEARPLFAKLLWWARRQRGAHEPKSGMGKAVGYLLRNRHALKQFLSYASIPPDNNKAEAGLRRVAVGRSNFLFVGNEQAGHDLAIIYTLVASCEKHGINPVAYLSDVLVRVQKHPASRIEELLPHRYRPPELAAS
jgi:transposase